MGLTTAAGGFVVFLLSVSGVQGQWGVTFAPTQVCATKGSTVEMHCTYTYPSPYTVDKAFWFTKSDKVPLDSDSDYTGRVEYDCYENNCTLRITNLTGGDSAPYYFRFTTTPRNAYTGAPGVTLSVTELQLLVNEITVNPSNTEAKLKCQTTCTPLSFVWFKNGQEVPEQTNSYSGFLNPGDNISCALKGHEDYRSPTLYALKFPSVSVSPSGDIMEGSSVNLTCSGDANPAATYTWYKNETYLYTLSEVLVFSSIQSSDSGLYYCAAENELGRRMTEYFIDVKYAPKLPSVSVSPSAEITDENSLTLTCRSDANPAANYTWYRKRRNPDLQSVSKEPQLVFSSIQSSDSGEYYCTAENRLGKKTSEFIYVNGKYGPKLPSVSVSPSAEIVEGSSVTLTCSSDANPAANYTWYKENQKLLQGPEGNYRFTSISSEDRGIYYCESENQYGWITSSSLSVDVQYAPKLPSVSVSPSAEIVEGSSVTLTCSSDANPAAKYTWYSEDGNLFHHPQRQEPQLVFSSIQSSDSGEYYCKAENELGRRTSNYISIDVKYGPRHLFTSVRPSAEIVEGDSVTLTCSSDANPAANYTWYKESKTLPQGPEGNYYFKSISSEDRGIYYCKAENQYGWIMSSSLSVDVQYAPKLPSVSVSPSAEIVEGSSVTLTCSSDANPAATYTWYKKNGNLFHHPQRQEPQLVLSSIQSSDSGEYYCKAVNELGRRTSYYISIDVKYAPKLPSVSVSPSAEIVEGSSVTLTCSSDANPAANYTWYKENHTIFQGPEGNYYFKSIRSEDRGIYSCTSKNQYGQIRSSLSVDVQYAPKLPSVSVSPSAEIVEGSSVTLTCSSDANPAAKYTWYKKNGNLFHHPQRQEPQLILSSIQSSDSGEYYCKAVNELGRRTSYYISIDVKYAPQLPSVSVSPSADVKEGSSVTLTCSSDANPAANYTWYKRSTNPEHKYLSEELQLVFSSIQSSDSGQYYCTAENELGRRTSEFISIDVQYAPNASSVSVSPSAEIVEGSSVTLTCSSDANPAANYTWYKENQTLSQGQEGIYHFTSISSEDSGSYNCKSENPYGQINSSPILIDVQYAPKLPSVSVSPSAEIVEGSSVTLTCSSDANPAANYTWYKKNINLRPLSEEPQLVFSSIQSSDSGQYYCAAENELATIFESILINVKYAPKLPSVSVSPSAEIVEGSSVNLTCSSDANPAANYTWYKDNEDSPKASGQIFTITDVRAEHSGNYYCEAQNTRGRHISTLHLTVVAVFPEVWKSVVIGAAPGVSLAVIWLSVFLLIRKMRASKKPSKPGDRPDPDNREQGLPSHLEEQDDLHYASVHFKTHTDPVYSNIRPAGLRTDEEEAVEYTAVVFNSASTPPRTTGQKSGEDPAAVYSTVSKTDDHNRNL
ncbi:hemicentin-2-like [Epinephelus fuscoguttatus]|uniref:hemicentin-2-like n=1 Tax=Epinephelus fuscoguttatus TaxID=293821 RepID=UPI0020D10F4E|nr:hemicentin-2-like [Epinephelus fuscoguttatus]